MENLTELRAALANYQADEDYPDDQLAIRFCELACESLVKGCYGVGAILVDREKNVLAEAGNEVFIDGFHSDRHAEMVVLDLFEERYPNYGDRSGLTMMISLEPCPMCFTRLLIGGIGRISYLAADNDGGMLQRIAHMPPAWLNQASLQEQEIARASGFLAELASKLATCSLKTLRHQLLKTIRE